MKAVGVFEAKHDLPKLLDAVEKGEQVEITRQGKRVARIEPVRTPSEERSETTSAVKARRSRRTPKEIEAILAEAREFRRNHPLRGISIRELIDDGRQR